MDDSAKTNNSFDKKFDEGLLEVLACPITKGDLEYDRQKGELISHKAGLAFPIIDGIAVMLVENARKL